MQLCFRGIHYNRPQSYIEYSEGEICGKYRGNPWKSHHHKLSIHSKQHQLIYRGVTYTH